MPGHADMVAVQYVRRSLALVRLDLSTEAVVTSRAGLQETLHRGLQDWAGHVVHPRDRHAFLSAG